MHYLAALRSGIDVDNVSREFAQELVIALDRLCEQFPFDFVNDTLQAIGLACNLTPDILEVGNSSYQWPNQQIQTYTFQRNELELVCVEQFLVAISRAIADVQNEWNGEIVAPEDNEMRDFETPVEYFMDVIAVWCNVFKQLLDTNDCGPRNMFVEPLAIINLHLFVGLHDLRKVYRHLFPLLDNICSRLFSSALQGLRYPLAHKITLQKLLKIVSDDIDLLSEDVPLFFYEALVIKCDSSTSLLILQELHTMLERYQANSLQVLTNILIKPEMMEIYYNFLISKEATFITKQRKGVLKFLDVLQSKLLTLDCFSREFMESILNLVARTKPSTASLGCKLYMDIMKRKLEDDSILFHILEFYVSYVGKTSFLNNYVAQFYKNFETFRNVYQFLHIIVLAGTSERIRLLCAHIVIVNFKIKFEANDTFGRAHEEIESVLLILPQMLRKLSSQQTIGILLQLFDFVAFDALQKQTIDNFIPYAVDAFKHLDNKFEYPLLMNIFIIFNKSLDVVKEWQYLDLVGDFLMAECRKSLKILESHQQNSTENPSNYCYKHLCCILKRINIIIKTGYDIFDCFTEIIQSLEKYVLTKYSMDFIGPNELNQTSTFIDIYALEVVTSCIIKLSKEKTTQSVCTSFAYRRAEQISKHLVQFLKNGEQFLKLPAFRMKAYFCSLLNMYCHLPLNISNDTYFHMIQILISLNLDANTGYKQNASVEELQQTHPKQATEYIRVMFRHFGELHKYDHVKITSRVVWQLCLHFGKHASKFNEELKNLLITLATYRFDIYKHILPVLVYNLHRQQPPLQRLIITMVLREHKQLIDSELGVESPESLKVHIVLAVLQIIEKALGVQCINASYNRIEALKQLDIFMEGLDLTALQAEQLIVEQANLLNKHLMTANEHTTLNSFLMKVQNI